MFVWWIGHMWPKCTFGDQKGLIWKEDMSFGTPLIMGHKIADFFKRSFDCFYFLWVKRVYFGSKNGVLEVFWTECEVADLKQRQEITTMDHRNKIQSLVL